MAMSKKAMRGDARVSPRSIRIAPSRTFQPVSTSAPDQTEQVEQTDQTKQNESEKKDDLPTALDLSEIKFVDGIAQIPIADLTADVPLIPFIPNKRKLKVAAPPFRFLELPSELRVRVYEYYFEDVDPVLDLDPTNYKRYHKLLGFMRVCKLIHNEATYLFYSTHTFRLFPIHPSRQKTKKPILSRLKPSQRQCLTTLDLCFGPGWNAPPRSWVVNDALGLKDCINVTQINVFVQFDPSDKFFKSFRRSEGFYENFSRQTLAQVLQEVPSVRVIEFDGWPSVKKSGAMMRGLMSLVMDTKLAICWGPERGWTDAMDEDDHVDSTPSAFLEVISHNTGSFSSTNLLVTA